MARKKVREAHLLHDCTREALDLREQHRLLAARQHFRVGVHHVRGHRDRDLVRELVQEPARQVQRLAPWPF